jgi:sulfate adenylyltransferase subunit 2
MPDPCPGPLSIASKPRASILREVAAGFRNPMMLYSIGTDSSLLLHLLVKTFYPARTADHAAARGHRLEVSRVPKTGS